MKNIPYVILLILLAVSCKTARYASISPGTVSMDRQEYIRNYSNLAVSEMKRTGVPASITLAQGLLESDNGNSTLAVRANNHFGIKCHNDWTGQRIYHDDDRRNECFRKYNSVLDSYKDHSDFLRGSQRYAFLFDLRPTDYKAWARGLKKAGYATNREYAELLVRIIEENNLHAYDRAKYTASSQQLAEVEQHDEKIDPDITDTSVTDIDNFTVDLGTRTVQQLNRIDYIVVRAGDTFIGLAEEFDLMYWELFKYNELSRDAKLTPGQILYLQPKRKKAGVGSEFHHVEEGETMYSISQKYGIKQSHLYKMNRMQEGEEPRIGDKLWLRKVKPAPEEAAEEPTLNIEFQN